MCTFIKKHRSRLLLSLAAALTIATSLAATVLRWGADPTTDEMTLVGRDVAFWLAGQQDHPNPTLELSKGKPVKLVVRNDEPEKVLHCFTIGGLDVKTTRDLATGESETLVFTPSETGVFTYACLMHPMMAGKVIVR
jgi:plastocyanin